MQFNYKHTTSTVNESFDNKRDSKVFDTIPENPYLFIIDFCNEIVNRHHKSNKQIKKRGTKMFETIPENPYLLLTPGPISTSKSVRAAMLRDWCTWDDDYNQDVRCRRRLKENTI